jgi:predicted Ser/Thr protein kinase
LSIGVGSNLGPYRVEERIGRGGMATVYRGYQSSLSRYVAIKVLPAFFAEEEGFFERFQQEAVAIARLRHPNILDVYDFGADQGEPYLVMEFIDGGTLADQVGPKLPVHYVAQMLAPVASALDYAHAQGIVHRDIKPSNVLLTRDGAPILSDFGIAKLTDATKQLTRTGGVVGTPTYMAPEQAVGEQAGPAADQYALAIAAYELLTGVVPFRGDTPMAILTAQARQPVPAPRSINPAISARVEAVLLKALAKRPEDRYGSVTEFVGALAQADGTTPSSIAIAAAPTPVGNSVPTRTSAPLSSTARRVTRRQALIGVAIASPLIVGAAGYGVWRRFGLASQGGAGTAGTPSMRAARALHSATFLDSGKMLVAGGRDSNGALGSAEMFDPATNSWSDAGALASPRYRHTATLLPDGQVLIAGGQSSDTEFLATAERYDPATNTWALAGSMAAPRSQHTATALPGGQALVAGGFNAGAYLATDERYDLVTNSWTSAGAMTSPRSQHAAAPLPNGQVLVTGGFGGAENGAERYDTASNAWTRVGSMAYGRIGHVASILPGGRVLVAGGDNTNKSGSYVVDAEVFDPNGSLWSAAGEMATGRIGHTGTSLPQGDVLIIAGKDATGAIATVERYDPKKNTWSQAGQIAMARWLHTSTLLNDGRVLVAGGQNGDAVLKAAERFGTAAATVAGSPRTVTMATLNNSGVSARATFTDVGNGNVRVEITAQGAGKGPQPAHIHEGPCTMSGNSPLKFTLAPVVNGTSVSVIPATWEQLTATPQMIHMHKSQDELGIIVCCGTIQAGQAFGVEPLWSPETV